MDRASRRMRSRAPQQPLLPYRNLDAIVARISAGFFHDAYADVTWCFALQPTLASITPATRRVHVHNVLNAADVPDEVFEMIIFHEMLHLEIPPIQRRSNAWDTHPPAFRDAERARCPHLATAWQWLHANLPLRRRPRIQCTDVEPRVLRLTPQQRAWARDRFGVALPPALRCDDPSSRRITVDTWRLALAARDQVTPDSTRPESGVTRP